MFSDKRRFPRFSYAAPVLFRLPDERLWSIGTMVDISLGGIFFKTNQIVKERHTLQFRLANLLDGILVMVSGSMVRIVDEAPYGSGVAVEFAMPGSSPELKKLCDYLMQAQPESLIPSMKQQAASTFDIAKSLSLARTILEGIQYMNYYQLLGLTHSATTVQLVEMRNTMLTELSLPQQDNMLASDRKVLTDAVVMVQQVGDILCNPHKRLAYDISQGQVDPFVVRTLAHDYQIDIRPYSAVWQQKHPDRIRKSSELWQAAQDELSIGHPDEAREKVRQAMDLDPFNFKYSINF